MMLRPRQVAICGFLAVMFWVSATLCIRLDPASVTSALRGNICFIASVPISWLCIWLIRRLARLEPHQILAGCMIVLGEAMLLDGVALRWFHTVYATDERTARLGAAWLLWGYGLSACIALLVTGLAGSGWNAPGNDHSMQDRRAASR